MQQYLYRLFLVGLGATLLISFFIGCEGKYKIVPVSGMVTVKGKPAFDCQVSFQIISEAKYPGPSAIGKTDSEGRFILKTIEQKPRKGAIPGKYQVRLEWMNTSPPEGKLPEELPKPYKLPPQAVNGSLEFEVPLNGTDVANFEF